MAIDPAGYCTQCRTYRGPVPVTAIPVTAPVTAQYPTGYQPGQYSAPPAPSGPPPRNRGPFVLPLIASCVALVIVAIAIGVVAVVKHNSRKTASTSSSSSASVVDSCVVGVWRVTAATLQWTVDGVGSVPLTSMNDDQLITLNASGTALDDYGQSVYQGTQAGHTYKIAVTGIVHYGIRTANDTLSFLSPSASGVIQYYVDGAGPTSLPLSVSTDPVHYTCDGQKLTEHTDRYDATLTKESG